MAIGNAARRLLFLDLRHSGKGGALPQIAGIEPVRPGAQENCDAVRNANGVLIAIGDEANFREWQERYQPLCPAGFPHVFLLDPYTPALARLVIAQGAADCCDFHDNERLELIALRLSHAAHPATPAQMPLGNESMLLRLQVAIDTLPSPIFIKDGNCRYIACNKAFESYLGLPRNQIVGATVYDVSPPELAAIYERADRELLAQRGTQIYETSVRYADGTLHDVIFHKSVFYDAAGEADGISGTILDITERKSLERKLELAAATDFLTGVANLRTFYELGGQELRRFARSSEPLSLLLIDIDHFKGINDKYGHAAGDEALRQFVSVVQKGLRQQDIFARAGGDEFRLLLPGTDLAGARQLAERLRSEIDGIVISMPQASFKLTISTGIAMADSADSSLDDICGRADAALYAAKAAGRNCVAEAS